MHGFLMTSIWILVGKSIPVLPQPTLVTVPRSAMVDLVVDIHVTIAVEMLAEGDVEDEAYRRTLLF